MLQNILFINKVLSLREKGMSPELWAIIGVGVALTAVGVTAITLGWNMSACLDTRLAAVEKGQARIEGWIAGRFREEGVKS